MSLSITTRQLADGTVEIRPQGEIDVSNAHEVRSAVAGVLAGSIPTQIRMDLWLVTLIDSVGVGALVASYHAAAASGVRLVVVNPTKTVHRQLWISGLIGLFGSPRPRTVPPE